MLLERRLSSPAEGSDPMWPQTSRVVSICSGQRACGPAGQDSRGVQKRRSGACGTWSHWLVYRDRIQAQAQRSSFVLVAAPNNSPSAHMLNAGLCGPVSIRSYSRSLLRHCSSVPLSPPPSHKGRFLKAPPRPRPGNTSTAHLATFRVMAIMNSRKVRSVSLSTQDATRQVCLTSYATHSASQSASSLHRLNTMQ
jgi:hypothetical protein